MKKINYTICYRNKDTGTGPIMKNTITLPNIKSLARYLNKFKKNNPAYLIIVAYVSDGMGKCLTNVRFLPIEYKAQKWFGGYKERLLATALDRGYDIKWNHGLKPEVNVK